MAYPTPTLVELLRFKYPLYFNSGYIQVGDQGSGPVITYWDVPGVPQPTELEAQDYADDPEFLSNRAVYYRYNQPGGYGPVQNQLFMIYNDLKNHTTTWFDHIGQVECVTYPIGDPTTAPTIEDLVTSDQIDTFLETSDLSSYVTSTSLTTTLGSYVLTSALSGYATTASLANYVLTSTLANYVTNSSLASTLSGYVTTSQLTSAINRSILVANNTSTQSISGTGKVSLTFNTETKDSTSSFVTDTYTAPESGIYVINTFTRVANIAILSLIAAYEWQLYVTQAGSVNQSILVDTYSHGILAALNSSLRGTIYLPLAAGDTIKIQVQKTVGTSLDCSNAYVNITRVRDL